MPIEQLRVCLDALKQKSSEGAALRYVCLLTARALLPRSPNCGNYGTLLFDNGDILPWN